MRRFTIPVLAGVLTIGLLSGPPATAVGNTAVGGTAPGAPGTHPDWLPAGKTGFGTARTAASNVWFTLQGGQLSELYYPDLSTPSVRSLNFVVTDGRSSTTVDADAKDKRVHRDGGLGYTQTVTDDAHRWRLRTSYVTDPARPTVLARVEFRSLSHRPYRVYAALDPDLTNNGSDDSAALSGNAPVSTDGHNAAALRSRPGFTAASVGYRGSSDGITQLRRTHTLHRYSRAGKGNVVLTGQLPVDGVRTRGAQLAIGMGANSGAALRGADSSLHTGFPRIAASYAAGWRHYLAGLPAAPRSLRGGRERALYQASVLMLAASEDKRHPGAFVASPSMPWRFGNNDGDFAPSGTYHLVWPRDLYQIATGLLAAGDRPAAQRAVHYMFGTQQLADGHLPQNSQVDGKPYWTSIQLDETALPIVLADQLGRTDAGTWRGIRKAAEFLLSYKGKNGHASPYTEQERWEEQDGYSPSTIAAVIAGLVCGAHQAEQHGAHADAVRYLHAADTFRRNLPKWTVSTNGPLSKKPYFLRLTKDGNANAGTTYNLGNSSVTLDQRRVTDAGFLDLVRLGVYPAANPVIRNSVAVTDKDISFRTPNGRFWHRYTADGYGERPDGSEWDFTFPQGSRSTFGRLWPLLAGERGEYELALGDRAAAEGRLHDLARASSAGDTLPEQVWDEHSPSGKPGFAPGTPTESATPLAWTHAQFLRLARDVAAGRVLERPKVVYDRYVH